MTLLAADLLYWLLTSPFFTADLTFLYCLLTSPFFTADLTFLYCLLTSQVTGNSGRNLRK
jgi:hypothetical protein